ncbi:MAG: methionine adenosyltransferase [Candidatus Woykebacteria bacterium RBG_16_44_10]|uniref:Methionine adenosyltransferase n=1 Tax=Candidatus Woykebacteria bacterium RBG_16_44_10 TaxID=1802597 RepID=A0A1G1WED5_9BACT|nr:MAG: methionine adenosyltransferase [Candidatus Woykebacteria bacterium RBG_16_44_10]
MNYKVFTSESVAAGHPDKICDQISDAIVDAALSQDSYSKVAVETLVTKNQVVLAGEVTSKANLDYKKITSSVIKDLGYTNGLFGFSDKSPIFVKIHEQSPEISVGVDSGGAGDQGMMFGFAINETPTLMPLPISIAHALTEKLDRVREKKDLPYLRPDGKSEVTVTYDGGKPKAVERVILAAAHNEKIDNQQLKGDLYRYVVKPVLAKFGFKLSKKDLVVNGAGVWHIPGPTSDTGVTGRKIIVDSYGAFARAGGGAFSGKDPTKVDRSGAYAARFIAKNIVAAGLADKAEVQIAYVIGKKNPVAFSIETFGSEKKKLATVEDFAKGLIDLSVAGILNTLNLRRPIYQRTAQYGHFGRDDFPWEEVKN